MSAPDLEEAWAHQPAWPCTAGLGLISASSLLLVLTLIRLFAVQQFYHFAFMAISMGLLGMAVSGSLLSVWPMRPRPSLLAGGFSLTTFGAYLVINYLPFDSFTIVREPRQVLYLAFYFLAAAVPFTFSGLIVGGTLAKSGKYIHRVYAVNLLGSAIGSLVVIPALATFGGEGTLMLTVTLGMVAAALFLSDESLLALLRRAPAFAFYLVVVLIGFFWTLRQPLFLRQRLSPYKSLAIYRLAPDARLALTRWNAVARVDVIESSSIHSLPGLGLTAAINAPPQAGLFLDGDNLMPITGLPPDSPEARTLAERLPQALAFQLRPGASTLILEPGAGFDVLVALASGATRVTVVEDNELILDILRDDYREFTGALFRRPEVKVVNQSGRSYARRSPEKYDLIVLSLTDPYRPVTSGAYSLTENYLYTVEAFTDYLNALKPGGLLLVNRWLQVPPSEELRTFGIAASALRATGRVPVENHVFAFRSMRTATLLVGERPFIAEETDLARRFLADRGFDPILLPGIRPEEVNRFNLLSEPIYYNAFQSILRDPRQAYADYDFDIRPPTDERPFFYHFFKWSQTPEIWATLGLTWQPFGGGGYFVLLALLLLVCLAAAILVFGPLLVVRSAGSYDRTTGQRGNGSTLAPHCVRRSAGVGYPVPVNPLLLPRQPVTWLRLRALIYFLCLGLGFLLVEVALAQKLVLLLDQPVIALAAVLFSLLTFSGIGSLTAPRWPLPLALAVLSILILAYPTLIDLLARRILFWPSSVRLLAASFSLAPLGLIMGVPFARGLAILERLEPGLLPWAWAINGGASAISPVLAVLIALTAGFTAVMFLGAIMYALALAAFWRLFQIEGRKASPENRR